VAGAKDGASAAANPPYKHDQHSLRWTFNKELGIIFVVSSGLERIEVPQANASHRQSTALSSTCPGSTSSSTTSRPSL
jgi:hypothetical protein